MYKFYCFPYDINPVWEMSDGSWVDIVDDSVDWVTSFEQGDDMDESLVLPIS